MTAPHLLSFALGRLARLVAPARETLEEAIESGASGWGRVKDALAVRGRGVKHSSLDWSTTNLQGERSYRRVDSVHGGQTIILAGIPTARLWFNVRYNTYCQIMDLSRCNVGRGPVLHDPTARRWSDQCGSAGRDRRSEPGREGSFGASDIAEAHADSALL
jgi:hypothetical protein